MTKIESLSKQLFDATVLIDGTLQNEEILTAVFPYGYTLEHLQSAGALAGEASALMNRQSRAYGEQIAATVLLKERRLAAKQVYTDSLKIARIAFRGNTEAQSALMLNGARHQQLSNWLEQTDTFYGNLLAHDDLLAVMVPFGYDYAKVEGEMGLITAVHEANRAQEHAKGAARASTKARDAKMRELSEWVADYKVIVRIALGETSQMLEGLGIRA